MGADIYLNTVLEKCKAQYEKQWKTAIRNRDYATGIEKALYQKQVNELFEKMYSEGYFRDSYNATSLSEVLGFSWWKDVVPVLRAGKLPISQAKKLKERIESLQLPEITEDFLRERKISIDEGENSVANWKAYFERKRTKLIDLLELSIQTKEPLFCSL